MVTIGDKFTVSRHVFTVIEKIAQNYKKNMNRLNRYLDKKAVFKPIDKSASHP